jgi:hypothetical protein
MALESVHPVGRAHGFLVTRSSAEDDIKTMRISVTKVRQRQPSISPTIDDPVEDLIQPGGGSRNTGDKTR